MILARSCTVIALAASCLQAWASPSQPFFAQNAAPTGGTCQIQYRLDIGEAGWVLRQDRIEEF